MVLGLKNILKVYEGVMDMELSVLIVETFKFIFPAYLANAIPVLTGGGGPLDFGAQFFDGKPVFGKNKTIRGFINGLVVGTSVGLLESFFFGYPYYFGLLLSLGALCGDLAGAFIKRRLSLAPGSLLPVIDQVSFIVGAFLFSIPLLLYLLSWELIIIALILTVPIHFFTNFLAYKLGIKKNPW